MHDQTLFGTELFERIDWLIRLRWLAVTGMAAGVTLGWVAGGEQFAAVPLAIVTGVVLVYNVQFLIHARTLELSPEGPDRLRHAARFAYVQIVLDLLALAALIHFSGGVESPAAIFFVFHAIIASILLSRRVSFLMATLGAGLFTAVSVLEFAGVLPHHGLLTLEQVELYNRLPYLITTVGLMALTLWLVAYMTSSISAKLRQRDRELLASHRASLAKGAQLEAINERLRRVDAERTRFITLVTHELRAPIGTIHTCAEVALAGYASPEKVRDILIRIKRRTAELLDLIGDLLRLARAREEESRDKGLQLVQPADVLHGVVQLMKSEADSKDLFLSVDVQPDLGQVQANPDRLKLVWTNLLSNAIKYTEPGGIVAVSLHQDSERIVGTVRDTGIGIAPEDQRRIFEEFYRAENAKAVSPVGTGVGLAIIQRLIENWGGSVSVDSEPGLGSKFTFDLPLAQK